MQPIKQRVNNVTSYADDRGIHLLYDVPGTGILSASELVEAAALRAVVVSAVRAGTWLPGTSGPLSAAQEARFVILRNKVASALIVDAVGLRDPGTAAAAFKTIDLRPELATARKRRAFMARYASFLTRYARRASLKQLAAMSLGTRRQTQPDWAGTFISLRPGPNGLRRETLGIKSPTTGRELLTTLKPVANVNVNSNNGGAVLFESQLLTSDGFSANQTFPQGASELGNVTFIGTSETRFSAPNPRSSRFSALKARIADRTQVLIPNSSCGSCHALQQDRAFGPGAVIEDASNFHNLSYFDVSFGDQSDLDSPRPSFERGLTPSPRVVQDVAFNLSWITRELANQ